MLQGQNLRQRALAQQQQSGSEEIAKNAMSGIYDTPEGQSSAATLAGPGTVEAARAANPTYRLRQAMAAAQAQHPDQPLTADEVYQIHLQATGQAPAGLYGYLGKEATQKGAMTRAELRMIDRSLEGADKLYGTMFRGGVPDTDSLEGWKQRARAGLPPGLSEAAQQEFLDRLEKMHPTVGGTGVSPMATAREGALGAQANVANARAAYLNKIADPMAQRLIASAGAQDQTAALRRFEVEEKRAGDLTPAQRATFLNRKIAVESSLLQKIQAKLPALRTPEERQQAQQLTADTQADLATLNAALKAAKQPTTGGATGAAPTGKKYGSQSEFEKAFAAASGGSAPSQTEIDRARAAGFF